MKKTITALLIASVFGFAHATAATSTATLTNVQLQLVDLNPFDGSAASLSVGNWNALTEVYDSNGAFAGNNTFDSTNYAISTSIGSASSYSASGNIEGAALSSTTTASTPGVTTWALTTLATSFTLSPGAELVLSADASVSSSSGYAGAYVIFSVDGNQSLSGIFGAAQSGMVSESFVNSGTTSISGSFGASTQVEAIAPEVTAVPEPAAASMLLAGVGLFAFAENRRRKSS